MLIVREHLFEMDSNAFGKLKVRNLSIGAINELLKKLPDYDKRPGRDVTIGGASVLCLDADGNTIDGSKLSEQELMAFSDQFLAAYPRITEIDDTPVGIERRENESSVDYCGRVLVDEIRSYHDRMASVIEKSGVITAVKELNKISDMFKENTKLSAFSKMMGASDSLRSAMLDVEKFSSENLRRMAGFNNFEKLSQQASIANIKPMYSPRIEIPIPPPNPIHKTNEKLETLTEQVEVFTETLAGHLTASADALKGVAEQIEKGSQSTSRQNNIMIGLTLVSVVIAVIATYFGFLGYTMGKSASERTQPTAVVAPMDGKSKADSKKNTAREMKKTNPVSSSVQQK